MEVGGSIPDVELGMLISGVVAVADKSIFAMSMSSCCRTGERLFCGSGGFVGVGMCVRSVSETAMLGTHESRSVGKNLWVN